MLRVARRRAALTATQPWAADDLPRPKTTRVALAAGRARECPGAERCLGMCHAP
jgi:hypothetical protein